MQKSVLCVDDNADHCELLKFFFENQGYKFQSCGTPEEFLQMPPNESVSAVILDNILRYKNGDEIFLSIKNAYPQTPVIFFTADAQAKSRIRAMNLGADAYLVKPDDLDNVVPTISSLLDRRQPQQI
jgi:DNA-binding response OmpR family regulator